MPLCFHSLLNAGNLSGPFNNRALQPQLLGNLQRVALAGFADRQPVQRPQGFGIEFHPRVLEMRSRCREGLQFVIMRRYHHIGAPAA
ncbi:hypothetical protein D3C75_1161430 [compost metagenome]